MYNYLTFLKKSKDKKMQNIITLSETQKKLMDSQGYVPVDVNNETVDLTLDKNEKLVPVQNIGLAELTEQKERVNRPCDIVWIPRYNRSHPTLKVTHSALFNNSEFHLGMTEAGHYSMFYKVPSKLNDNYKIKANTLQDAIEEASRIALIIEMRA